MEFVAVVMCGIDCPQLSSTSEYYRRGFVYYLLGEMFLEASTFLLLDIEPAPAVDLADERDALMRAIYDSI